MMKPQSRSRQQVLTGQSLATATVNLVLPGAAASPACGANLLADDCDFRNDGQLAFTVED
jgi:hypothetical protein